MSHVLENETKHKPSWFIMVYHGSWFYSIFVQTGATDDFNRIN